MFVLVSQPFSEDPSCCPTLAIASAAASAPFVAVGRLRWDQSRPEEGRDAERFYYLNLEERQNFWFSQSKNEAIVQEKELWAS